MKNASDKSCRQNQNTFYIVTFSENTAVYEKMWKNVTVCLMHIASWMPKATNTHTQFV